MISFVSKKRKTLSVMTRARRIATEHGNSHGTPMILALFHLPPPLPPSPSETHKRQCAFKAIAALLLGVILLLYAGIRQVMEYQRTPRYQSLEEQEYRRFRFPSVEQRVKLYMSNWYLPPCDALTDAIVYESIPIMNRNSNNSKTTVTTTTTTTNAYKLTEVMTTTTTQEQQQQQQQQNNNNQTARTFLIDSNVSIGHVFYATEQTLQACFMQPWSIRYYCSDCKESMFRAVLSTPHSSTSFPPLFVQFSDETLSLANGIMDGQVYENPRIPIFKKIRHAIHQDELNRITTETPTTTNPGTAACYSQDNPRVVPKTLLHPSNYNDNELQPIIWKMNVARHYGYLKLVKRFDRPWSEKWNRAVFRGNLTGFEDSVAIQTKHNNNNTTTNFNATITLTDQDTCLHLMRCRLVLQYAHSKRIDAKLTSTAGRLPEVLNGINLTGNVLWKEEMLAYKGIIILEGNDVSSGLKWAMLSQSVVLMPPPTFTSWAMEELLEPWIHYIPLDPNLTDVEQKVQWMLDHEAEAQRISHRAFLWIMDLVYHPDAMNDELLINQEIMRRYRAQFISHAALVQAKP